MKIIQKLFFILFLLLFSFVLAEEKSENSDIFSFQRIGQVAVSPTGKYTAWTSFKVENGAAGLKWRHDLHLSQNNTNKILLKQQKRIANLSWSPEGGELAFIEGDNCIKLYNIKQATEKTVVNFSGEIISLKWSPQGDQILFLATPKPNVDNMPHVSDIAKDFINSQLYIININDTSTSKAITSKNESVSQFMPAPSYDWSPDGKTVVYVARPRAGALYDNDDRLRLIDLSSRKEKVLDVPGVTGAASSLFSPDGKSIAFKTNLPASPPAPLLRSNIVLRGRICVSDAQGKTVQCLAQTPDQNPYLLGWNSKGSAVFVMEEAQTHGWQIYSLPLNPKEPVKKITLSNSEGYINFLTLNLNRNKHYFGFSYETENIAPEAYRSKSSVFDPEAVSNINEKSRDRTLGELRRVSWKSFDGRVIEGLLRLPTHYNASKTYPLLVDVHGGPMGAAAGNYLGGCREYGESMLPTTCWGHLLKQGFIIFSPNPRGSSGYGTEFALQNFADAGGGDFSDIMSGVDYLIKTGVADPAHLAISGWSYGGYLTSWAITQTNRFEVAIEGDGITDLISFSGTSDIPDYFPRNLGAYFWNDATLYQERSPINFVKKIKTPTLIIEGESDLRVPPGQAFELYTALMMQNKPVRMLLLPKQGHVPSEPNLIYAAMLAVDQWLNPLLQ